MSDIMLQEGQLLIEEWTVQFEGRARHSRPVEEWVECRIVKMYHGTMYGGANGVGKTVEEARLNAVLGLANAICDDVTAFDHDADEIFKGEMYRWFLAKLQEMADEHDSLDEDEGRHRRKTLKRRINHMHKVMTYWQEDHDYYPEAPSSTEQEASEARTSVVKLQAIRARTDRRRAASARLREKVRTVVAAVENIGGGLAGTDTGEPVSSADRVLDSPDRDSQPAN